MRRVTGEVHIASLQALVDPVGNVKIRFPHRGAGNFSHWNFREQFPPIADNPPHGGIPGVARGVVDDAKEEHKSSVMEEHVSEVGFEGGFQGQVREMPRRDKTLPSKLIPRLWRTVLCAPSAAKSQWHCTVSEVPSRQRSNRASTPSPPLAQPISRVPRPTFPPAASSASLSSRSVVAWDRASMKRYLCRSFSNLISPITFSCCQNRPPRMGNPSASIFSV